MDIPRFPSGGHGYNILNSFTGSSGVWSLLAKLFTREHFWDSARLLLTGGLIEIGRRSFQWLSTRFRLSYGVSARFSQGDPAYNWLMLFLTETTAWKKSRTFKVTAKSAQRKWTPPGGALALDGNADYVPSFGQQPLLLRWNGYWVDVTKSNNTTQMRNGHSAPKGTIYITVFTRNVQVLRDLVEEARIRYQENGRPRVTVHLSDSAMMGPRGTEWNVVKTKLRRPLNTLALEEGVLESILADAQEFLKADDWYTEVGIPHRRGYLLHGPPGTGKTSTIYAIAGELGLEIYSLSLAAGHVNDSYLQRLVSAVPRNSILLIEDIDCAFPSRDDEDEEKDTAKPGMMPPFMRAALRAPTGVTLSGLLNVLDGVGSDEGRIFFATTNHPDRLDAALIRPGRVDKQVEYKLATQRQARAIFDRFFPASRFGSFIAGNEKGFDVEALSVKFGSSIPEHEFSTAEIQGFLLTSKTRPDRAVEGVDAWVEDLRRDRREKAEREQKRKEAKEAKAAKAIAKANIELAASAAPQTVPLGRVVKPGMSMPVPISIDASTLQHPEFSAGFPPLEERRSDVIRSQLASIPQEHPTATFPSSTESPLASMPVPATETIRASGASVTSAPLQPEIFTVNEASILLDSATTILPSFEKLTEMPEPLVADGTDDFAPLAIAAPLSTTSAALQPETVPVEQDAPREASPASSETSSGVLVDKPLSIPSSPTPSITLPEPEPILESELSTTSSKASVTSRSSASARNSLPRPSTPSRAPFVRPSTPSRGMPRPSTPSRSPASSTTRKASSTKIPVPDHVTHSPARPRSPMLPTVGQRNRTTSHTSTSQASVASGTARPRLPSGWRPHSPPGTS